MFNTENVNIGDEKNPKIVVVREVKVRRILASLPFGNDKKKDDGEEVEKGFMSQMEELLQESTGLTGEELQDLHGSEIEALWEAFKKVNSFFFKVLRSQALEKPLQAMLDIAGPACGEMFADLLKEVMEEVSTTDSAGSLPQSKTPNDSVATG